MLCVQGHRALLRTHMCSTCTVLVLVRGISPYNPPGITSGARPCIKSHTPGPSASRRWAAVWRGGAGFTPPPTTDAPARFTSHLLTLVPTDPVPAAVGRRRKHGCALIVLALCAPSTTSPFLSSVPFFKTAYRIGVRLSFSDFRLLDPSSTYIHAALLFHLLLPCAAGRVPGKFACLLRAGPLPPPQQNLTLYGLL
jgi:hypothetical protein